MEASSRLAWPCRPDRGAGGREEEGCATASGGGGGRGTPGSSDAWLAKAMIASKSAGSSAAGVGGGGASGLGAAHAGAGRAETAGRVAAVAGAAARAAGWAAGSRRAAGSAVKTLPQWRHLTFRPTARSSTAYRFLQSPHSTAIGMTHPNCCPSRPEPTRYLVRRKTHTPPTSTQLPIMIRADCPRKGP